MIRFVRLFILTALSASALGARAASHAEKTAVGSYRSTVALVYRASDQGDGEIYCSGTIVGHGRVLTAAHCLVEGARFFKVPMSDFLRRTSLYIGDAPDEAKIPRVVPTVPIAGAKIHPEFTENLHDLAVLTFQSALVPTTTKVEIAELNKIGEFPDRTPIVSVGFGILREGQAKGAKRNFSLPARWIADDWFTVGQTESDGPSICHGDSGGSAYAKNTRGHLVLVGVSTSAKGRCGRSTSYYQAITPQIVSWIQE